MKKSFRGCIVFLLFLFFIFSSFAALSALEKKDSFVDFSMEEDLSWLQGTWKLEKWETNNHGVKQDDTNIYNYQLLVINGNQKLSELIEKTETSRDGKESLNTYSVEDYFMTNSHESGHSNKVNQKKTKLLLTREFALDPEVIFSFTFIKQ